ncbi:hypothetical protein HPB51_020471 [Rhipicephalus microplus]|uniref:Secreted protein n=1 Tax=Rhipicephalus microplus TaxID=6941 RepID=A0A9J6DBX5_RHIMP|nr:hypothetical protein HPB51_020471 [Rhipicephalus microplus]
MARREQRRVCAVIGCWALLSDLAIGRDGAARDLLPARATMQRGRIPQSLLRWLLRRGTTSDPSPHLKWPPLLPAKTRHFSYALSFSPTGKLAESPMPTVRDATACVSGTPVQPISANSPALEAHAGGGSDKRKSGRLSSFSKSQSPGLKQMKEQRLFGQMLEGEEKKGPFRTSTSRLFGQLHGFHQEEAPSSDERLLGGRRTVKTTATLRAGRT